MLCCWLWYTRGDVYRNGEYEEANKSLMAFVNHLKVCCEKNVEFTRTQLLLNESRSALSTTHDILSQLTIDKKEKLVKEYKQPLVALTSRFIKLEDQFYKGSGELSKYEKLMMDSNEFLKVVRRVG